MSFKKFIKTILLIVLPVLIIVISQAIAIFFITENYIIQLVLVVLLAIIDAFLEIKWILFVSDNNWI